MFRFICLAILILVNFTVQTTLLPHIRIFGAAPDTALILIVGYAIIRGDVEGMIFGFCAGLVQDLFGGALGMFAMMGMITGYVCGKPFKNFFRDNYFLPFLAVTVAVLFYQIVLYITNFTFRGQAEFLFFVRTMILPKTVYTASLSIPIYAALYAMNNGICYVERNRRLFKNENEE